MLNLAGLRALVVGGGGVGVRKAQSLLEAGADVTLVGAQINADVIEPVMAGQAAGAGRLTVLQQEYDTDVIGDCRLVFACTDDPEVNSRIASDARSRGAMVNAADQPADCDFFMPAVIRDEDVVVAIGTGGAAPALSAWLSDAMRQALPPRIGEFASLMERYRARLRQMSAPGSSPSPGPAAGAPPPLPLTSRQRMEIMKGLSSFDTYRQFCASGQQAIEQIFTQLTQADSTGRGPGGAATR